MSRRFWPRGLRARLLVAFALVTMLGAVAAAWASSESASTSLLDSTRKQFTETVAGQVAAVAPELTYPPDQAALDRLRAAVGPNALVTYRDRAAAHGAAAGLLSADLRAAVGAGDRVVMQRITADGNPWLLLGTPIAITAPDGARRPSGIAVYAARDLSDVEDEIDSGLRRSALTTAVVALPLAALLALLAARGVLRPVRELRDTARRLAAGDLDARSPPRGADELADLTETINEMAASVQSSMAAMQRMQADARRFVADVSHELRTPLSTLTAVMEVLENAAAGMEPDARESAQLAIVETQRLVALVEDLMEVSRFDAGTAALRLEEVDVTAAVIDCLRARGWLDRVELIAAGEPGAVTASLDRRRLDVIVANLVGNALRHGAPPVRVAVAATREQVSIEVTDRGPGLGNDVAAHVFDRFYKADAARARTSGSGLGLAIGLENAHLHGGEIVAGNAAGGGARFVLRLPREGTGR